VAIEIIVLLTTAKEAMFIGMLLFFHQCEVVGIIMGCWVLLLVLVLGGWWWRTYNRGRGWLVADGLFYVFRVMAIFNLVVSLP
jgi:hypothetical protein